MIKKILASQTYQTKVVPISLFLVVELLFLLAFNLGNLAVAYRVIALVLAVLLLPTFLESINKDMAKGFLFVFLPLVIFLLAMTFSPVFVTPEGLIPSQSVTLLNRGFFVLLMTFVGAISFLLLGYFVSHTTLISKHNFIFLIIGGIALLLFISLLATLVNYGFFHRIIYAGRVNFYDAVPYPIADQANLLIGFSIQTVQHHILTTMSLLALTPIFGLFFIKDLSDKRYFALLVLFAAIGLLTIIFLVDFKHLVFLIPAVLLALMIKFKVNKMRYFKPAILTSLGLVIFLVFVGVLAALEVDFVVNIIKSNALTSRIFYNGYTNRYMGIIKEAFDFNYIFGNPFNLTEVEPIYTTFPSKNLILDLIRETGLIGGIAFIVFAILSIKIIINYLNHSKDKNITKYMIVSFLLTLFIRYMFFYPFNQLSFQDSYWNINYFPFVESKEFAISLFLIGYMYISESPLFEAKKEVTTHE